MTTQPPMPQLESVPPPTYQKVAENAESNQQPHVHQTAGDEKTGDNILGLTGYDTVKGTQSYISNQGVE